jgi:hypothetical protein
MPMRNFFTSIITQITGAVTKSNELKESLDRLKNNGHAQDQAGTVQGIQDRINAVNGLIDEERKLQRLNIGPGAMQVNMLSENRIRNLERQRNQLEQVIAAERKRLEDEQRAAASTAANAANRDRINKENADAESERLEKQRKEREQANSDIIRQLNSYNESLEELHIKNDEIANDEKQLLELRLARQIAAVNASKADAEIKNAAIAALQDLYHEQIRLSEINFAEQQLKDVKNLQERLNEIPLTEQQVNNRRMDEFKQFLASRLEAEEVDGENRISYLNEQAEAIITLEKISGEEKLSLHKAVNAMILDEERRLADEQKNLLQNKLNVSSDFFSALSSLASQGAKDNVAFAVLTKATASASAAINSYLAGSKALAEVPYPWNFAAMGTVIAAGLANQIRIMATDIPSAETGGRFIVPNSPGSDNTYMRVNGGEEVEVTPRGMAGFRNEQTITVLLEKQVIFNVVNDGIRGGDILISAGNY